MASTPHPSSRPRQTWRERSRPSQPTAEVKRVRRWLLSFLFLVLVALFVWIIWSFFFAPRVIVACLPVVEYPLLAVPPVPFGQDDFDAFKGAGIVREDLANCKTYDSMKALSSHLVLRSKDTLVLYLSAHGVSMDGKGYLLCSDFSTKGEYSGRMEISALLQQVHDCQAGEKILILDAGHLPTMPHLGLFVNEFPKILADAVSGTHDEHLWVLTANSMHESSHVSHSPAHSRSVFNYFVVQGLAGNADVNPPDGMLDLAELVTFVGWGVTDWVKDQSGGEESQTPAILWGGGDVVPAILENRMRQVRLPLKIVNAKQADEKPLPPDAESKPSNPTAADNKIGISPFATLRHTALFAAPVAALARQARTDPTTDAKTPTEPQPATTSQPPTAKVGDQEPPKAAPAGPDPKTSDPLKPATPADTTKADKPSADQTTSPQVQPKGEAQLPSSGNGGHDELSSLRKAWEDRDQGMRRSGEQRWCPIDYAPHLWREYEDRILNDELSRRDKIEKQPKGFDDGPLRESMKQAVSDAIRKALQDRNDYFDRAVDITAWHARASCGAKKSHPLFKRIQDFLGELAKFDRLLEKAVMERPSAGAAKELENQQQKLSASWEPIEQGLNVIATEAVKNHKTRTIEDLLSTPLLGSKLRMELLAALDRAEGRIDSSFAGKKTADRNPVELLKLLRQDPKPQAADLAPGWQRAADQARLEMQLVRLADPETATDLEKLLVPRAGASEVRSLGKDLADYYLALPAKVRKVKATSESSALRRADRQLRLLPASDAHLFADEANPIPWLKWSPPPSSNFYFEGFNPSKTLVLDSGGWTELKGSLKVHGTSPATVTIAVRYNPAHLEVKSTDPKIPDKPDQQSKPMKIDAQGQQALSYQIRPRGSQQKETDFTLVAIDDAAKEEIWTVKCSVPPPEDIELVVLPADDFPNEALISPKEPGRQGLATFPGHVTSFVFQLKHQSQRPRKVRVELRAVGEVDQATIRNLGDMAKRDPRELSKVSATLLSVKEMTLPATSEAVPIEFTAVPPQPPKEGAAAAAAPPKEPTEKPRIDGGLICIVSELERKDLGPWVTWIQISPWAPKDYIKPTPKYFQEELTIGLELTEPPPQDGEPIKVAWDVPGDLASKSNANLTEKNQYSDQLKANIDRDRDKILAIRLDVDGYPRAFEYKVPLIADKPNIERERSLTEIAIVEPKPDKPVKVDGKSPVIVDAIIRVSAPDDAFATEDDQVQVWIDSEGDGMPNKPNDRLWTGFADRQVELQLEKLGADGRVAIRTTVTDFHRPLHCDPLNGRFNLIPRLVVHGVSTQGTSIPVIFDSNPPTVTSVEVKDGKTEVFQGEMVLLAVTARDGSEGHEGSGIKSVNFVDDTDDIGKLNATMRKAAEKTETKKSGENGIFALQWKTQETDALGPHTLLVWATDNVGWESAEEPVKIVVKPKTTADAAGRRAAAAKAITGTIKGLVTYGGPAGKVTVTLDGGKKSTKTDDNGEYVFKNLPPGDYKLEAKGIVKNGTRQGKGAVTVPTPPPRQPLVVPVIKLE